MSYFRKILVLSLICIFCCGTVHANAVIDVFNTFYRGAAKDERLKEHVNILRNGSVDIGEYAGLEINVLTGEKKSNADKLPYKCSENPNFDSDCRDWALDGVSVRTPSSLFLDLISVLGDKLPLDSADEYHHSAALQYMKCLAGTQYKGTEKERVEVKECKDLGDSSISKVFTVGGIANLPTLESMYAPEVEYFVSEEGDLRQIVSRPKEEVSQQSLTAFRDFIRKEVTTNVCTQTSSSEEIGGATAITAKRLALAQGYALAVVAARNAENFTKQAVPYMHSLVEAGSEYNPRNIRQDIHLLLAADAGMIYLLGQINGLHSVMTEIDAFDYGVASIKTFNGVTHLVNEYKTQEELCK